MTTEFRWPVRVYIEDTDAGGIVYYVNYLKFMERARTELLRSHGYGKAAMLDGERMFVVQSVRVDYRAPARLDDELMVTARVIEGRGASLGMEQQVFKGERLLCGAHVLLACVDRATLKPRRIPPELLQTVAGTARVCSEKQS